MALSLRALNQTQLPPLTPPLPLNTKSWYSRHVEKKARAAAKKKKLSQQEENGDSDTSRKRKAPSDSASANDDTSGAGGDSGAGDTGDAVAAVEASTTPFKKVKL